MTLPPLKPRLQPLLLAIAAASLLFGCTQQPAVRKSDPAMDAYRLIDEQRTDEAIELLERALEKDDSNQSLKTVLASAYAHKAGVRIQTLVPVINQVEKLKLVEFKPLIPYVRSTQEEKVNLAMLNIAGLLKSYAGFSEAFSSIPTLNHRQSVFLIHAISLLDSLGTRMTQEDALYRAILEVVWFKHIVATELLGEFVAPEAQSVDSCRLDLGRVNDAVVKLGKLMIDIYGDLGHANPDQAQDMARMSMNTADAVSDFTIAITAIVVFDEAANLFMKQMIIQNGFGKAIRCGGL